MKKIILFAKKEIKIIDKEDLNSLYRVISELYESNLLDEVLIVDNEKELSNIPIEFYSQAYKEINILKNNFKKLNKEVLELKDLINYLVEGIQILKEKINSLELEGNGKKK